MSYVFKTNKLFKCRVLAKPSVTYAACYSWGIFSAGLAHTNITCLWSCVCMCVRVCLFVCCSFWLVSRMLIGTIIIWRVCSATHTLAILVVLWENPIAISLYYVWIFDIMSSNFFILLNSLPIVFVVAVVVVPSDIVQSKQNKKHSGERPINLFKNKCNFLFILVFVLLLFHFPHFSSS